MRAPVVLLFALMGCATVEAEGDPRTNAPVPAPSASAVSPTASWSRGPTVAPYPVHQGGCVVHEGLVACSDPWPEAPKEPVVSVVLSSVLLRLWGCAITARGELVCWGKNADQQLGLGVESETASATRLAVPPRVVDVAITWDHGCAVTEAGALHCWSGVDVPRPTQVEVPSPARAVTIFDGWILVTLADQRVAFVDLVAVGNGRQPHAQIIEGSRGLEPSGLWPSPIVLCGLRDARLECIGDEQLRTLIVSDMGELGRQPMRALAWSKTERCGIDASGSAACSDRSGPYRIPGLSDVTELVPGEFGERGCARMRSGDTRCFELKPGPQTLHDPVLAGRKPP